MGFPKEQLGALELRSELLFGSCFISCDGWYHPTTTTKPYPQKFWFVSPFCSFPEAGVSNPAGSASSKGDGRCHPYQKTALPGVWISLPHFGPAWSPVPQDAFGSLHLWFGKKAERKSPERLLYLWSLDLGLNLTHRWDRVEMEFSPAKTLRLTSIGSFLLLTALFSK